MSGRGQRACDEDHLAVLAGQLHAVRLPWYSYTDKCWLWVPPWGDHDSPERLGRNWLESSAKLHKMLSRTTCEHGRPRTRLCEPCRTNVVENLRAAA